MKLAIIGVTGLVGKVMREVLEEFQFEIDEFIPVASTKSVGNTIDFMSEKHKIISIEDAINSKPDIAIFSAGAKLSLKWAEKFAENGTYVIDNSSAWRMDPDKKLIVPEINASELNKDTKIIANPNCSTIQLVMALAPLHRQFGIKRLVVSTYQSYTGTGKQAVDQYDNEKAGLAYNQKTAAYHYPIFANCIPHCDVFLENDYTKEEMKLVNETKKILNDSSIGITATAVRVPVNGGHSESVNIEFNKEFAIENIYNQLSNTVGITVLDDPKNNAYPMPLFAKNKNEVFVGRIRKDESAKNAINMWIVADNLRKGAATNAVQIAMYLKDKKLV